ncbi:unnamed protein product [Linum tenue]|uniref:Uncharacterized protein n=1 Tax=Linum tenue TaxID=586396 RepID=A0AAV0P610_9ROSI|nr:unnamed protein product [Linum tenue]
MTRKLFKFRQLPSLHYGIISIIAPERVNRMTDSEKGLKIGGWPCLLKKGSPLSTNPFWHAIRR